jgi:hypothetical protein
MASSVMHISALERRGGALMKEGALSCKFQLASTEELVSFPTQQLFAVNLRGVETRKPRYVCFWDGVKLGVTRCDTAASSERTSDQEN